MEFFIFVQNKNIKSEIKIRARRTFQNGPKRCQNMSTNDFTFNTVTSVVF